MVNANVIRFLHVPSSLRGIPESPPWDVRVGFPIIEFGMDPTTNLLILLEVVPTGQAVPHANRSRIHLATLSDGASHPGAQLSELELEIERYTHHWSYTIQTCGDLLGILYAHPRHEHTMGEYHLVIWDWRRGAIVTQVSGNDLESFTFLDHGRLMLGRIPQRIDHDLNGMQVHLELYSFEPLNQPDTTRPLRKLGVLKYPTTEEDVEFSHLNIRMDPAVAWRPPTTHNVPFHVGDEERIINIQWHGFCDSRAGPIIHFVHLKTVLDHVRRLEVESRQVEGDQFIDVPWKEWGPHGSRLWVDNLGISHNWLCYVYGSQWIYCERRRGIAGTAQPVWLTLRDFSSVGVRHAMFMGQLSGTGYKTAALGDGPDDCISFPGDNWSYILTDTVAKDYFVEPVTTSLPYRERFGMTPPDILPNGRVAPMLSEDAILLVQVCAPSIINCNS